MLADVDVAARVHGLRRRARRAGPPRRRVDGDGTFPAYFVTGILMLFLLAYGRRYFDGFVAQLAIGSPAGIRTVGRTAALRGRRYLLAVLGHSPRQRCRRRPRLLVARAAGVVAASGSPPGSSRYPADRHPRRRHPRRCSWRSVWRIGTGLVVSACCSPCRRSRRRGPADRRPPHGARRSDDRRGGRPARVRAVRRRRRRVRGGAGRDRPRCPGRRRRPRGSEASHRRRGRAGSSSTGSDHSSDCRSSVLVGVAFERLDGVVDAADRVDERFGPVGGAADQAVAVGAGEHAEPAAQLVGAVPAQLAACGAPRAACARCRARRSGRSARRARRSRRRAARRAAPRRRRCGRAVRRPAHHDGGAGAVEPGREVGEGPPALGEGGIGGEQRGLGRGLRAAAAAASAAIVASTPSAIRLIDEDGLGDRAEVDAHAPRGDGRQLRSGRSRRARRTSSTAAAPRRS